MNWEKILLNFVAPALLATAYLSTRLANLTLLPIFNDEAQYLHYSHLINQGISNLFISLQVENNRPLFHWLTASVLKYFDDPLLGGRTVSVVAGFFSMIGVYAIASHFHSKWAGWVAAIFYVASPYHLFFERLAHKVSLLNCFFIWMVWITIRMFKYFGRRHLILMGGVAGLGLLTESTAILFAFIPLVFKLFFCRDESLPSWRDLVLPYLIAVFIGGSPYLYLYLTDVDFHVKSFFVPSGNTLSEFGAMSLLLGIPKKAFQSVWGVLDYFAVYLTWPVLLLAAAFFISQLRNRDRSFLVLGAYFVIPFVVLLGTAGKGFSRYYLFCSTPLLIWGALGFAGAMERLGLSARHAWFAYVPGLFLVLFPAIEFDHKLLTQPQLSPLVDSDRAQYVSGEYSGYGIRGAVEYFKNVSKDKKIVLLTPTGWGNPGDAMAIYLSGRPNIDIHMAHWLDKSPLLPPATTEFRVYQKYTGWFLKVIRISDFQGVYFICKSVTCPRDRFLAINRNFMLVESFGNPSGTHYFDIYKWEDT